jgi:hypothetical protein
VAYLNVDPRLAPLRGIPKFIGLANRLMMDEPEEASSEEASRDEASPDDSAEI